MAPTDRDDKPKSSAAQENSRNPFVQFKHFADTQASIALQGLQSIIGLPSAFVKHGPEHNGRWATWDDDVKKRVLSKAQQARYTEAGTQTKEDTAPQHSAIKTTEPEPADSRHSGMDDEGEENGPALYMAMSPNLIDRFMYRQAGDDAASSSNTPRTMSMIQSMVLGAMTFSNMGEMAHKDQLYSMPSVLPYLLFSPYSPLQLKCRASRTSHPSSCSRLEQFPYEAAFEDLLLASQGKPMIDPHETSRLMIGASMTPFKSPFPFLFGDSGFGGLQMDSLFGDIDRALRGMRWLSRLDESGLLGTAPRTFIKPVVEFREALPMWTAGNGIASDVFREIMALEDGSANGRFLSDFFGTAVVPRNAQGESVTESNGVGSRRETALPEKVSKARRQSQSPPHAVSRGYEDIEDNANAFNKTSLTRKQIDAVDGPEWHGKTTQGTNAVSKPDVNTISKREVSEDCTQLGGSIVTRSTTKVQYPDGSVVVTTSVTTRPAVEAIDGLGHTEQYSETSRVTSSSSTTPRTGDGPSTEEELYREMGVTLDDEKASGETKVKDRKSGRKGWFWE